MQKASLEYRIPPEYDESPKEPRYGGGLDRLIVGPAGHTALAAAEQGCSQEELEILVQHEISSLLDDEQYDCTSSLLAAAELGRLDPVERLLRAGAEVHNRGWRDTGPSAMQQAAINGALLRGRVSVGCREKASAAARI